MNQILKFGPWIIYPMRVFCTFKYDGYQKFYLEQQRKTL